ncbi:MAG: cell wall-binding repeat-containing protein [Coriobacteriia bacterium]|nr:cell wall-binding repeat-containing protein [Coriobacteriia bacterium]
MRKQRKSTLKRVAQVALVTALAAAFLAPGIAPAEAARTGGAPAEAARTGGAPAEVAHTGVAPAEGAHTGGVPAEVARAGATLAQLRLTESTSVMQVEMTEPTPAALTELVADPNAGWKEVSAGTIHSLGIRDDGSLLAWGDNGAGQLGDGTWEGKSAPTLIGDATDWKAVSAGGGNFFAGAHSLALKEDGSLWAWGANNYGQLGDGTWEGKSTPVRIGSAADWKAIGTGNFHSLALKNDGSLWAWGWNEYGQLGNGTKGDGTSKNVPTRIGVATDWEAISVGFNHSLALKTDGTLWAWGINWYGGLGDGTKEDKSTPTRIGDATDWKALSAGDWHSLAIKDDGSLWAWGTNFFGEAVEGEDPNRYAPARVGTGTSWRAVAAGGDAFQNSYAIKSDGSLWIFYTWGDGRYDPVRVGIGANWKSIIGTGLYHSIGIKADGSLWSLAGSTLTQITDTMPPASTSDVCVSYPAAPAVITITATDNDAGVKEITYILDGGTSVVTSGSSATVTVNTSGRHTIEFWAKDNAGNREVSHNAAFTIKLGGVIERVSGADRYQTAIEASKKNFEFAEAVVLTTGTNYADALSASALAGSLKAPILLTHPNVLSNGVLNEIKRLGAEVVCIIGSEAAVSKGVESALDKAGFDVVRIDGEDRYETSAYIAYVVAEIEGDDFAGTAFLARGDNFADGLAVAPLAYANKIPVILTKPAVPSSYAIYAIQDLDITDFTIVGSTAAVSDTVKDIVARWANSSPTFRRIEGSTRYETAEAVAKYALENDLATKEFIGVATGTNFPDALAGGVATGEQGGILVLTTPNALSPNWDAYLRSGAYAGVRPDIQIYGGANVVSDNVKARLQNVLLN